MAFLLLTVGLLFTAGWAIGLAFSVKSDAPKNPIIPAAGVLLFIGVSLIAMNASMEAMDNPPRLTPSAYDSITDGMAPDAVQGILGPALTKPDRSALDLPGKGVSLPSEIVARLAQGQDSAEAVQARLSINIEGTPSKRNAKEGLGASAIKGLNGVVGLQIILTENGNTATFTEGEHWKYENGDTAEAVAKKIGDAINAHASWTAVGSPESAPKRVNITSSLESNNGTNGNSMTCRAAPTATNTAVRVGYKNDGSVVAFRGGQDSVALQFWLEQDGALDGDFTMTDRLVVVGYVDNKVHSMKQAGLGETARDARAEKERQAKKKKG